MFTRKMIVAAVCAAMALPLAAAKVADPGSLDEVIKRVQEPQPKTGAVAKRVQRIKLWIDKKTYLTSKIEYVEGDGDVTRYEFTNIKVNQPIPQGRFVLNLPANVKVENMKLQ